MGLRYCRPVANVPEQLDRFQKLTLLDIRNKVGIMIRDYQKKGLYYISHHELREVLGMTEEQVYLFEDLFSVNRDIRRINSIEFWCSLALASVGGSEDKVAFCFQLMDGNADGFLSYNELFVLMVCACRGAAKLKGLLPLPADRVDKLATNAFKASIKTLQDNEISCEDFQMYILTDDLSRGYLAALGAKLPPVDAAAIVLKRANILRELAAMRHRTDEIFCEMDELENKTNYETERGGDSSLLSLQNQNISELVRTQYTPMTASTNHTTVIRPSTAPSTANGENEILFINKDAKDIRFEDLKDTLDLSHPANKYYNTDDLWINQVYDLRKNKKKSKSKAKTSNSLLSQSLSQRELLLISRQQSRPNTSSSSSNLLLSMTTPIGNNPLATPSSRVSTAQKNKKRPTTSSSSAGLLYERVSTAPEEDDEDDEQQQQNDPQRLGPDGLPSLNIFSTAFETMLWKEWEKLPQEIDHLAFLDEITLMAVFDRLNIIITYSDAKKCLKEIPKSQLMKYHFQDILSWFRHFYNTFPIQSSNFYYPIWRRYVHTIEQSYQHLSKQWNLIFKGLEKQKSIITGLNTENITFAKKLANFRSIAARKPTSISRRYYINGIRPNKDEIIFAGIPDNSNQWKTRMKFVWSTNPFTNMSTKRSRGNTRIQWIYPIIAEQPEEEQEQKKEGEAEDPQIPAAAAAAAVVETKANDSLEDLMRHSIAIELENKEKQKKEQEILLADVKKKIIKREYYLFIDDYPSLQATDILDYYNIQNEEEYQEMVEEQRNQFAGPAGQMKKNPPPQQQQQKNNNKDKDNKKDGNNQQPQKPPKLPRNRRASALFPNDAVAPPTKLGTGPKVYATVSWFVVEIKPNTPFPQIILLKESIQEFFELIPLQYHENVYSEVKTEICVIETNETTAKDMKDGGKNTNNNKAERKKSSMNLVEMLLNTLKKSKSGNIEDLVNLEEDQEEIDEFLGKPKIILISLLLEKDVFTKIEEYFINSLDLFISRFIYQFSIECNFLQSLPEIFQYSFQHYNLENKIFGPQENELIEKDLINPLKYAKEIRSQRKNFEEMLTKIQSKEYNKEELSKICKEYGYYDQGSNLAELTNRVQSIIELKLELLNHGELNSISKKLIEEIYLRYHIQPESLKYARETDYNWKFWEFNEFLYETNIQTLYNKKEHEQFAIQNALFLDNEKQLSLSSLYAYYERIGHLMDDILTWKVGNVDSFLTGVINMNMNYDPNTLPGIFTSFYEKKPLFMNAFMKELMKLMIVKDYNVEKRVNSVSEIIDELFCFDKLETNQFTKDCFIHNAARGATAPPTAANAKQTKDGKEKKSNDDEDDEKSFDFKAFKQKLIDIFKVPGEFAQFINSFLMLWNSGNDGILPNLRKYLYEEFLSDSSLLIHRLYHPLAPPPLHNSSKNNSAPGTSTKNKQKNKKNSSKKNGKKTPGSSKRNTNRNGPSSTKSKGSTGPNSFDEEGDEDDEEDEEKKKPLEPVTLLDTLTFDPVKEAVRLEKEREKAKKNGTEPPNKDSNNTNEDQDSTVYYDTEDEAKTANLEIKERIIFDQYFTQYYLEEYEILLQKALKEEEIRIHIAKEERAALEAKQLEASEQRKQQQEKSQGQSTPLKSPQVNEQDALIDALLTEPLPEIVIRSDEEIEEEVCYQLAWNFLHLRPKCFETAVDTNPTTEADGDPSNENKKEDNDKKNSEKLSIDVDHLDDHHSNGSATDTPRKTTEQLEKEKQQQRMKDEQTKQKSFQKHFSQLKNNIITDLIFLYQIRTFPGMNISLEESEQIEKKKMFLFQQLQFLSTLEYESLQELTKSFVMMYDCLRLFSTDLSHIGFGTKDFCLRFYINNLFTGNQSNQLITLLPKGLNELSPIEEYEKNKLQRYINRKMKALAAIEREKLRRNMTEEEKEKLRQEKLLQLKQEFIIEEKQLFHSALSELIEVRELSVKNKEMSMEVVKSFQSLVELKESRFPLEFQTQIARNNLACVLYELYGVDHPLAEQVPYLLQDACEQIVKLGFDDERSDDPNAEANQVASGLHVQHAPSVDSMTAISIPATIMNNAFAPSQTPSQAQSLTQSQPGAHHMPPGQNPLNKNASSLTTGDDNSTILTQENSNSLVGGGGPFTTNSSIVSAVPQRKVTNALSKCMIIINYIHILHKTESFSLLKQAVQIKNFLIKCFLQLSNSEKHKLRNAVIPEVDQITVFHLNDIIIPKKQVNHIITILEQCQKEYDYHEKQLQMLAAMGGQSQASLPHGLSYSLDTADDQSVASDLHSVMSQSKKSRIPGSSVEGDDQQQDDDLSIQSESKKRKLERESKKNKYMEQRKKDQLARQEISQQRNKLYNLIQTDQISEIFARKANKLHQAENVKWGKSNKTEQENIEEEEQDEEEAEEEFLELAKGMASHKVLN